MNEYTLNNVFVITDGSTIGHAYTARYDAERKRRKKDILFFVESLRVFEAQYRTFNRTGHCPVDMGSIENPQIVLYYLDCFQSGFVEAGYFSLYFTHHGWGKALLICDEAGVWMDDPDPHSWDHYNPFLSARERRAAISFAAELAAKLNRGKISYHEISDYALADYGLSK